MPNSIAAAAVQQMLTTATVTLTNRMKPAVNAAQTCGMCDYAQGSRSL